VAIMQHVMAAFIGSRDPQGNYQPGELTGTLLSWTENSS